MKKSKSFRLASMILSVSVICTMALTGCGGSSTSNTSSSTVGSTTTTAAAETTSAALEPVKLTWLCWGPGQTITDNSPMEAVNKKLKEAINAELTINWIADANEYKDKVKMMTAAGESFDFEYVTNETFAQYASKKSLTPLNDLLDTYGQNVKAWEAKTFGDDTWKAVTYQEKIYTVPLQVINVSQGLVFDKDIVTKLGIDYKAVKNLSDLTPILEKIKKEAPDKTPFYPWDYEAYMGSSFDIINGPIVFDGAQNKATILLQAQVVADNYKLVGDWYKKGLVAKEAATVKDQIAQLKTKKYAVMPSNGYLNDEKKSTGDYGFPCVEIRAWTAMTGTAAAQSTMVGISSTSQNPERAMMLLDLGMKEAIADTYNPENIWNVISYGFPDKHYKLVDGKIADRTDFKGTGYENICGHFICGGSKVANLYTEGFPPEIADGFWESPKLAEKSPIAGFVFDPEPIKNEIAQINQIWSPASIILKCGAAPDVDKYIAETLNKMNKAGLEKVLTEVNKQITDWKAAYGK